MTDLKIETAVRPDPGRGRLWWVRPAVAWGLAGGWSAWAVARLAGADRLLPYPGSALVSLTPYVAAAVPVPIVAGLLLRRRGAAVLAVAAAAGLAFAVVPRMVGATQPRASGPVVRVLSANLFFSHVDPDFLYALIGRTHPDLVSVQEFTPDEQAGLKRAGIDRLYPYQNLDAQWGASGSGLYSRYPLEKLAPQSGTVMSMPNSVITLPSGRRFTFTVVHPVPPIDASQTKDWKHDLGHLPSTGGGTLRLMAGDFNGTLDMALFRSVLSKGYADSADQRGAGIDPTWGVDKFGPPLSFDHVLADKRCAIRHYEIHRLDDSDHRAVVADVQLP